MWVAWLSTHSPVTAKDRVVTKTVITVFAFMIVDLSF